MDIYCLTFNMRGVKCELSMSTKMFNWVWLLKKSVMYVTFEVYMILLLITIGRSSLSINR